MVYSIEPTTILGIIIIVINILPLIFKKPKFLILTGALSLALIFAYKLLSQ